MTYAFYYKCRLCGETFEEGRTGSDDLAFGCTTSAVLGLNGTRLHVQAPSLVGTHITSTHYGVADYIGAEQIEGPTAKDYAEAGKALAEGIEEGLKRYCGVDMEGGAE